MHRLRAVSDDVTALVGESRRRRVLAALGLTCLVALTVGIVIGTSSDSSKAASPAAKVSGATSVQYRDLIATDTESGTLSYANQQTVYNRLSGTITWLPAVGAIVKPGGTLFDVDNAPVVLFDGTTPAYRDLDASDTDGPDIRELNRDLKTMGFDSDDPITLNNEWQAATTNAVDLWQESLSETETGIISLGQVVFLPGKQEITTIDTTLGSTGGASGTGSGASYIVGSTHAQFVSLTTTSPGTATAPGTDTTGAEGADSTGAEGADTTGPTGPTGPAVTADTTTSTQRAASAAAAQTCNGLDVQQQTPGSTTQTTTTSTTATATSLPTCNHKGATGPTGATGKSGTAAPSEEAVLLALLKAETLELKKTLGSSGTGTGATGRGGTTGSRTGSGSSGGGRPSGGGGGGGGGGSSAASAGGTGSTGGGSGGSSSAGGASADPILQTSSTDVIVTVDLDATKQSEAIVGERVTVEMPAGNTINGKITQVSPIAQSSSSGTGSGSGSGSGGSGGGSSSPSATIPVTIALLDHHLPTTGLDQAAVSVNFQQEVQKHVLSVPVTALLATAGGGYAVQEAATPHKLIAVTPGLFAAGYVQISGSQIYSGLQVTDSQG